MLLAVTSTVWWQWRSTSPVPAPVAQTSAKPVVNVGPLLSAAPASSLRAVGTNVPIVPADPAFPNRLRNTKEPMETLVRNDRALLLANAIIDTGLKARLEIPEHLRAKTDPGSYIVQSRGMISDSFRAQLTAVGAEVIAYIPNNAYLVKVNAQGAQKLTTMPWTRAVIPYEPYYKLQEKLLGLAIQQAPVPNAAELRLTIFPGDLQAAKEQLEKLGAKVMSEDRSPFGPQLIVQPQKDSLVALASLPAVQTVERHTRRVLMNDLSRPIVGVASNSVSLDNYRGLTGENVLVGVVDAGIDVNFVGLINRVIPTASTPVDDLSGHGTHVAATLAGTGAGKPVLGGSFMGSAPANDFRGMAPAARILSQDYRTLSDAQLTEDAARNFFLTDRLTLLAGIAQFNTLIVNSSWGYEDSFEYDTASAIYDAATRDGIPAMSGPQPMLFVFPVGNRGFGGNDGLGGLANTISSLAAAKNVIAVGASELMRNITNEVNVVDPFTGATSRVAWWAGETDSNDEVAAFSGRGNTGIGREGQYGRAKPDVVAPGVMTISGRSPTWDEAAYYNPVSTYVTISRDIVLQPGQANSFALFLPTGTDSLTIEVLDNSNILLPIPNVDVYISMVDTQPSSNLANLDGPAPLNRVIAPNESGIWFYDLVNTDVNPVTVQVRETYTVRNNLDDYYAVLQSQLNTPLDPNYRFEVGTSMAAPVVSGILALMQEFFETELGETTNSPALYKAMLINSARTLSETYGHETKNVINFQGWGLVNVSNALPMVMSGSTARTAWPLQYFDQSVTNSLATGESHVRNITMSALAQPFPLRVTLVWTDPPGNPAASVKLVNDLDLVVSNRISGEVYYGNDFPGGSIYTTGSVTPTNAVADAVNNVENVFLPGGLSADYAIYVTARRVNVNAVTGMTNGIVQDYALVVSTGDLRLTAPFNLDQTPTRLYDNRPSVKFFTSSTNGLPFMAERVGANPPMVGSTNGTNVQWNFYVITNDTGLPYMTFVSFKTPNLSGDPRINTYRDPAADIDLYVHTSGDLTNLNPVVVNQCFQNTLYASPGAGGAVSTTRGGSEYVLLDNSPDDQVYYIGIKAEDQKGAEFGFIAVASSTPPFEQNPDGSYWVQFFPIGEIPDGSPEKPEGLQMFGIVPQTMNIHRVVATNEMTHDLFGDLLGTLEHNGTFVTLHNHTFPSAVLQGGSVNLTYDDSDEGDILNAIPPDGPGTLNGFVGADAAGVWTFTMIDNAPQFVGRMRGFHLRIEEENDITDPSDTPTTFGLAPGRSYYLGLNVPPGVVKVEFDLTSTPNGVFSGLYVKKGGLPNGLAGDYDHGIESATPIQSPLTTFSITTADIPPLTPGRHYIQVLNLDSVSANYTLSATFTYDLAATAQRTTPQRSLVTITDDAQTATNQSEIIASATPLPGTVFAPGLVAGVRVGVRIAHPRPADLVLRISNSERSVLLSENRGGLVNQAGYGWGENENEIIHTHYSDNLAVASQMMKFVDPLVDPNFVHFVTPSLLAVNRLEDIPSTLITTVNGNSSTPTGRLIDTGQTAGQIRIRYMFYTAQDSLSLYDSSGNPMPAGNPTPNQILLNEDNEPALPVAPGDIDPFTDTINLSSPGFVDGAEVSFFGGGPGGVSARVRYFIVNTLPGSFQLSLTSGGAPVDITSTSPVTFGLYLWETTPMIPYTSADGVLEIIVNEVTGVPGTGWDYIIELFDTFGVPVTPPATAAANQTLHRVVHAGTNLYVTGTTEANGNNGIYARFGLPMQTDQTPFESVNWPNNGGGTRFRDITYAALSGKVYVAGDSFTGTTDNTGAKETKGIVVRFPDMGLNPLDPLGSEWAVPVPGVTGVEGLEEMHAIISNVEGGTPGTLYLYAAGNAITDSGSSRLKVVKLDDTGTLPLINFIEDEAGVTTVSAGRGIAVLKDPLSTTKSVFVAGFSDDDGTMRPVVFKFDTSLVEISRQALPVLGQFNGLIAYDGFLYAVGVQDALSGSGANFLIVKYDYDLNVIWSTVGVPAFDLGDEDILYGVAAAGNRLYAVGSTVAGGAPTDGVMLEVLISDGSLVTRPAGAYAGITRYDVAGVSGADSFRDVVMEGSDLYVVGDTTRAVGINKDALILRYHVKDDYLPEEPLENFIGDVAAGVWRLEVIDTRTNNPVLVPPVVPRIIDWELQLFLADTNVSTFRLDNAVDYIGTIQGGTMQYFVINAPMTASTATHELTVDSGTGSTLTLYHEQSAPPVAGVSFQLIPAAPADDNTYTSVLSRTTTPALQPGQRYFLAVQSTAASTVLDTFTLRVTFDTSATTFLASGTAKSGSFSDAPNIYQAYKFLIPAADNYAVFELSDLTGDVEVRLRRGQPASESNYDILTTFTGTNYGTIAIAPTGTMPEVSGFWYALVKSLSGTSTSYQVRIMPPNQAPVLDAIADQVMTEGSQLTLQATATDPDVTENSLTYSLYTGAPYGMTINPTTGVIQWTPDESQGPAVHEVTVVVTDSGAPPRTAYETFQVTVTEVNSGPVLPGGTFSASEHAAFTATIQAADADLPANPLTYTLVGGPAGMTINASTGVISWTPSEAHGGTTQGFSVSVSDNQNPALTSTRAYQVTVAEVNVAPVFGNIGTQTVKELETLLIQSPATDADTPANTLTYRFVGSVPSGMDLDTTTGRISWTPTEAQGPSTHTVTVEVQDNGVPSLTTQKVINITVQEANLAPVLTAIPAQTIPETQPWTYQLVASDADLPANTLSYTLLSPPTGMTVTGSGGLISWTPTQAQGPNTYNVTVLVSDNGSPSRSATRTLTVSVTEMTTNVVDLVSGIAVTNTTRYTNGIVADIYRLNVTGTPSKLLFEAFNLSGDGDLLVRRGAHPTPTQFDYSSTMMDTNREQVVVSGSNLSGEWFATLINRENTNIVYSISGTIPVEVAGGAMLVSTEGIKVEAPVFTPSDVTPEFSWTAVQGEKYQVEVSTNLTTWTPLTNIVVTGTTATFTDPTPYTDSALRFYRIRQMPQ